MPPIYSLLLLLCATPLALPPGAGAGPAAARGREATLEQPERHWETLVLPAGFALDLQSGVVVSRPGVNRASLSYIRGRLSCECPLRLLPSVSQGELGTYSRDEGEAVSGVMASVGQTLIFDLYGEAWGLLRILRASAEQVTVELLYEPDPALRRLQRRPVQLDSKSGPSGVHLDWKAVDGALYLVERRRLAAGPGERNGGWNEVAQVGASNWTDEEVNLAQLSEYRVSLVGDNGGFGASALGVPGLERSDVRSELGPGAEFNLLCALEDGQRVDLTIETIRANGVHIAPGEGVLARMLTLEEEASWSLDEVVAGGYPNQRFFVPPGRVLALRTAEGLHCLLRVEDVRDGFVVISRQLDLRGNRLFPPSPITPLATWEKGYGVVFRFLVGGEQPPQGQPLFVVERETALDSNVWKVCAVGAPGSKELVDEGRHDVLLARYRFRQGLNADRLSAASKSVTVLVGGESAQARHAMLQRAISDLGAEDFAVREQARGVLQALGEGAWPLLREALRSDNAELATNARELLVRGLRELGSDQEDLRGGLARLLLSIRAEELGLEAAPHMDWTDRAHGVRALASLRGLGWRSSTEVAVTAWRRVLAEADPDKGVQLAASLALLLAEDGFGLDLGDPEGDSRIGPGLSEGFLSVQEEDSPPGFPWSSLVEEQARFAVERAGWSATDEADWAEQRLTLAGSLSTQFERTGDELFLDCALRLVQDPVARLQGAMAFARKQRSRRVAEERASWRQVRLAAADTALLGAELELLNNNEGEPVEIVLPAGVYQPLPDRVNLSAVGARFRLRGEGRVEIRAAFTLLKGCDATFENIAIVPEIGTAINVAHSSLLLRNCEVRGGGLGILGTNTLLELEGTVVLGKASNNPGAAGVRCGGRSMLLARESLIECPGVAIAGLRAALIDRCVITSTGRNGIEGGNDSDLWMLGSLLRAKLAPYQRIARGVLEGVAVLGRMPSTNINGQGVHACYDHFRYDGDLGELGDKAWLPRCSLGR